MDATAASTTKEQRNGEVRQIIPAPSQKRNASQKKGDPQERQVGKNGQESQAGHRHRSFRGATERSQGPTEEKEIELSARDARRRRHPTAIVSPAAHLAEGVVVLAGASQPMVRDGAGFDALEA